MATLTVVEVDETGIADFLGGFASAAGGGDQFANTGKEILYVSNNSGGNITVTITAQNTSFTDANRGILSKGNAVVTVGNGDICAIGYFPKQAFNDSNGNVQVTYSGVTSVTVGVFKYI